jgi:ssDNA-binding Zn-finger/Zn-ribbon topoisomerase 1
MKKKTLQNNNPEDHISIMAQCRACNYAGSVTIRQGWDMVMWLQRLKAYLTRNKVMYQPSMDYIDSKAKHRRKSFPSITGVSCPKCRQHKLKRI